MHQLTAKRLSDWYRAGYDRSQGFEPIRVVSSETILAIASEEARLTNALEPDVFGGIAGAEVEVEFADYAAAKARLLVLDVFALTMELGAFRRVPVANCNGGAHSDCPPEIHPLVVFFCDYQTYFRLKPIFKKCNIGLTSAIGGTLLLFTRYVREFVSLGFALGQAFVGKASRICDEGHSGLHRVDSER